MQAKQRDAAPNSRYQNSVNLKIVSRVVSIAIIAGIFLCIPQLFGAQVARAGSALLFCCLLITASVWDLKKTVIPNTICLVIFLTGLIDFSPVNLYGAMLAMPFLLVAHIDERCFGGGDIKFLAAACSVLGVNASIWAFAICVPLPIVLCVYTFLKNVIQKKPKPWRLSLEMPMIPILTLGLLPAYLLKIGGYIL